MAALEWGKIENKVAKTGVSKATFAVQSAGSYPTAVVWDGLTAFNKSKTGGETTKYYADNTVFMSITSTEELEPTIEAYDTPDEFDVCNGLSSPVEGVSFEQQTRVPFAFTCQTLLINEELGKDYGYEIHIVYGCKASPTEESFATTNENIEPQTQSFTLKTTPVKVTAKKADGKPYNDMASIVLSSVKLTAAQLTAVEAVLYGDTPKIPLPDEILSIIAAATISGGGGTPVAPINGSTPVAPLNNTTTTTTK